MKKAIFLIIAILLSVATVFSDVKIGDHDISANTIINDDLLIVGNSKMQGVIEGDLTFYGDVLEVSGVVKGDLKFVGSKLHIKDFAEIEGSIEFIGDVFLLDEGAQYGEIGNQIYYDKFKEVPLVSNNFLGKLLHLVLKFLFVFFAFFVFRRFIERMDRNIRFAPLNNYLWGLFYYLVTSFAVIIFIITIIGIPISFVGVFFFLISLLFASTALYLWLGKFLTGLVGLKTVDPYIAILIGGLIVYFLRLIPGVDIIYYITIYTAFMGAFFVTLFLKRGLNKVD